jgi:hypothetical protein
MAGTPPAGLRAMAQVGFDGVRIFSATTAVEREELGERVTRWLRANPGLDVVDQRVLQSSDERHHCLSIVIFYTGDERTPPPV